MTVADYQRIVSWIQRILAMESDPSEADLRNAAREFDLAVEEVNKRLRECDQYLVSGHRSEALQLAECDPNLLEAVRVLDFPELAAWIDYLGQFQVTPPQVLLVDVSAELNDAYVATQPLEKWLRMNRLHALARSDLKTRSDVLRQLAQVDASNSLWEADLKVFETQRLKDLRTASDSAVAKADLQTVAAIETELTSTPWRVETPTKLIQRVRQAHDRLRRDDARKSLHELAHKLSGSFSALDIPRGKQHLQRWMALIDIADLANDDELLELAGPAIDWLNDINRREQGEADFNAALQQLNAGLDEGVDRTTLERLFHQVSRFGRDVPNILMQRVIERRHQLDVRATRRTRLMLAVSMASVVFLVGLTAFFIQWQAFAQEVARNALQLDAQIKADHLVEARQYLDSLQQTSPKVFLAPEIAGLAATLKEAEQAELGRAEQFQHLVAHAREVGLDHPSRENFEPAFAELKQAEAIAKSSADKARVKEIQRDISREKNRLQKEVDDRFKADLDDIVKSIDNVSKDTTAGHIDLLSRLGELQSRKFVSDVFRSPVPGLTEKVKQEMAALEREMLTARRLSVVTDNVGQRGKFLASLMDYAKEQAGTTRAADFRRVAEQELKLWDGADGWVQIRERWKKENFKTISAERARDLLEEYNKLMKETPYPGETGLAERIQLCNAVVRRKLPAGSAVLDSIDKLLNSPTIKDLYVVETAEGKRYYTNEVPEKKSTVNVRCYLDLDLEQKTLKKLQVSQVPSADAKTVPLDWLSPQTRFRNDAIKLLQKSDAPWEELFGQLTSRLMEETSMDPILKLQLLGRILELGSKGSVYLTSTLKTPIELLNQGRLPITANWLDANDEGVEKLRSQAKATLLVVLNVKKNFEEAGMLRDKALESKLGPSLRWVGWVRKEQTDWRCIVKPQMSSPANGDLIVVHAGVEPNSPPVWAKVGDLEQGRAQILPTVFTTGAESLRVEGRPVFLAMND